MIYVKKLTKDCPDSPMLEDWIRRDPVHSVNGVKLADVFEDGTEAALICDEHGPLMAVRFHRALRVAMQFRPDSGYRIAKVGKEVTAWLQKLAGESNCKEVIIRPGGKADRFTEKLGFKNFIGRFLGV